MRQSIALFALALFATGASAHPVPKDNHDRRLVLHLQSDGVLVEYRLEVDELRAALDLSETARGQLKERKAIPALLASELAEALANNLDAHLDDQPLTFRCQEHSGKLLDHVRCDFRFRADWPKPVTATHTFRFRECNYELDRQSLLRIEISISPALTATKVSQSDDALLALIADRRTPDQEERLRKVSVVFRPVPNFQPGVARAAIAPDLEGSAVPGARGRIARLAGAGKPTTSVPHVRLILPSSEDEESSPDHHSERDLLHLFLDTQQGFAVLLLLAALFGAAHALTPGHGKAVVAAYLIGQRGTIWHALFLGLVVTLTHTGGVILLALVLAYLYPDVDRAGLQSALSILGGLLIAGLGLWLLMQRLAGRADHVHLVGGHSHGGEDAPTWRAMIIQGIAGGIVPCWDACVMLVLAISSGRLWLAVPLLLAFSAGLAAVLVALGVGVVLAGNVVRGYEGPRLARITRALPILSAIAIFGLGLGLAFAGASHSGH